jgi:hypothetical protein
MAPHNAIRELAESGAWCVSRSDSRKTPSKGFNLGVVISREFRYDPREKLSELFARERELPFPYKPRLIDKVPQHLRSLSVNEPCKPPGLRQRNFLLAPPPSFPAGSPIFQKQTVIDLP